MKPFRIIRRLSLVLMNRLLAFNDRVLRYGIISLFLLIVHGGLSASAQCPANLGFETGNFDRWECSHGWYDSVRKGIPIAVTPPLDTRHTIFKRSSNPGKDPYGKFPIMCPNGSEYVVRLGNDSVGGEIDRITYTVTVPSDKDVYSIIYNYAVVFQDPAHTKEQQPRFTAKVFDVATNDYITCSSFDFSASADLPGFRKVPENIRGENIFYKPWTPVTIKLIGYAGKTLKLEFTASDCTLGAHFGYAYLDVNEDCTTPITGNALCIGTNATTLVAPYGFREYNWYTPDFSKLVGKGNTLRLSPLPPVGTKYALELLPFPGSGCVDTLFTTMETAPAPFQFKAVDSTGACAPAGADLTAAAVTVGSSSGLNFSYFSDSLLAEYAQEPRSVDSSGIYYIKAANSAGCIDVRPIKVTFDKPREVKVIQPAPYVYPQKADLTNQSLYDGDISGLRFSFWKNDTLGIPVPDPTAVDGAGIYVGKLITTYGCFVLKTVQVLMQLPPPPNAFSPNNDGINDVWIIPGLNKYDNCIVDVYDRGGRLVFHSVGYNTPWNGTLDSKPLPVGTYYFVIRTSDQIKPATGSVTIIR